MAINSINRASEYSVYGIEEEAIERPIDRSRMKVAKINFLSEKFEDGGVVGAPPRPDMTESKNVSIRCYSRLDELKPAYNFFQHGFQYCDVDPNLLDAAEAYSKNRQDTHNLDKYSVRHISAWGKENGIKFDAVVPIGFIYRDLDPKAKNATPGYHLAHADMRKCDIPDFEAKLELFLKNTSTEPSPKKSSKMRVVLLVNQWMRLNDTENTLTLLNKASIDPSAYRSFKNTANSPLISQSLQANSKQEWVACEAKDSHYIIFDSCETIHSAVNLPAEPGVKYDEYRRSVEGRFAFIIYEPES